MTLIPNKSLSVLNWAESTEKLNHQKWWTYGQHYKLYSAEGKILPFQFPREKNGVQISTVEIIDFNTGAIQDITANMVLTGLQVAEFVDLDYDLIIYEGNAQIGRPDLIPGTYYLKMEDGNGLIWYSEVFIFCLSLEKLVKVEYWHGEDFCYNGGHIRYTAPFKNRLYVDSDIAKPNYPYLEEVEERDGFELPLKQISYKQYRFEARIPEFLIDALRGIPLHDFVEVTYDGDVLAVDKFIMNDPVWFNQGDLARVEVELRTDTIVLVDGRGVATLDYTPTNEDCIIADRQVVGRVIEGSADYLANQYLDIDSNTVALIDNDYILVEDGGGDVQLFQWVTGSYNLVIASNNDTAQNNGHLQGANKWYFSDSNVQYDRPYIETVQVIGDNHVAAGQALPNTLIEIQVLLGAIWTTVSSGTSNDFEINGIPFIPNGASYARAVTSSLNCTGFAISEPFFFDITNPAWTAPNGDFWQTDGGLNWIFGS